MASDSESEDCAIVGETWSKRSRRANQDDLKRERIFQLAVHESRELKPVPGCAPQKQVFVPNKKTLRAIAKPSLLECSQSRKVVHRKVVQSTSMAKRAINALCPESIPRRRRKQIRPLHSDGADSVACQGAAVKRILQRTQAQSIPRASLASSSKRWLRRSVCAVRRTPPFARAKPTGSGLAAAALRSVQTARWHSRSLKAQTDPYGGDLGAEDEDDCEILDEDDCEILGILTSRRSRRAAEDDLKPERIFQLAVNSHKG